MESVPLLLTPGPLTTDPRTRAAAQRDYGSRDEAFVALTQEARERIAALAAPAGGYTCVLLQGSGTFAVEATLGTLLPPDGKLLVVVNGAYGRRMHTLVERMGREVISLAGPEDEPPDLDALDRALGTDPTLTHVAVVACETTTGLLNPLREIARIVAHHGLRLIVDAMSAFGALPLDAATLPCDALIASSNKCLEGLPGVGFAVVRTEALEACAGRAHSVSLDLFDQWVRLEKDGQWRFTPPTHVIAALVEALRLHDAEGGVAGRGARYAANCARLVSGMRALGFETLLPDALQAPIIVTFLDPAHEAWDFEAFYEALRVRGFAIYPGKLTERPTFRVGCIGQVHPADIERFLGSVREALAEIGVPDETPVQD